jgi:hypothetical protein
MAETAEILRVTAKHLMEYAELEGTGAGEYGAVIKDDDDVCVLLLVKGQHRYGFTYQDSESGKVGVLRKFGEYAGRRDMAFSWFDAAKLSYQVRGHKP